MKNSKKLHIATILLILILGTTISGGELRDKTINKIKEQFGNNVEIKTFKLTLSPELKYETENFGKQRFLGKFVYYYKIKDKNEIIGYAVLDNVKGKVKPITYLVIFNLDRTIKAVEIIKYREQYGGAVKNKEWLNQFSSKNIDSELQINNDIDGISGATISVKSVIKGVKRLLYLINNLDENEKDFLVSIE